MLQNVFRFTTGLEFAVETLKSFILTMALLDNHLTVETVVHLSRLELEFQVCSPGGGGTPICTLYGYVPL